MDDIRDIVRAVVEEFMPQKTELEEERKKREGLEQRVSELMSKTAEAERSAAIRAELQRQGVAKVDLAYRAIKDEILRGEDGQLIGMREQVEQFVKENPELLPARLGGGSGAGGGQRSGRVETQVELEKIRPGMSPEELDRVRQEIARVASQTLRGW